VKLIEDLKVIAWSSLAGMACVTVVAVYPLIVR
jgi:hypothetical protein